MQVGEQEPRKWGGSSGTPGFCSARPSLLRSLGRPLGRAGAALPGSSSWPRGCPGPERASGTPPPRAHTPLFSVFPARTTSTCPSTSRPASCSVGRGVPAQPAFGGARALAPRRQQLGALSPEARVTSLTVAVVCARPVAPPASLTGAGGTVPGLYSSRVFHSNIWNVCCPITSFRRLGGGEGDGLPGSRNSGRSEMRT